MAKNILLKDQDTAAKSKGGKGTRKKRTTKAKDKAPAWYQFSFFKQAQDTWADERTRSVAGLFALGVSLILALGILSSMVTGNLDIRIIQNAALDGPREGYHNLLGSVGAHAGYFLARQGLGIGALALPFLLGLLGLRWLTDRPLLPLGRTLQLTAILAMFVPYAIGFLTNTVQLEGDPGTSFLDDHIVGAAGLWAVGTLIHLSGFPGAGILAGVSFAAIMAYYAPSLWRRIRQKAGSLQRSSTEAMAAEDAQDEAAMKRAAARAAEVQSEASAPDLSAEDAREQAIQNVLLASEDKNPVAESVAPVETLEDGGDDTAATPPLDEVPFDVTTHQETENDATGVLDTEKETTLDPVEEVLDAEEPPKEASSEGASDAENEEDIEFEVKETAEEETMSFEQLQDLTEEFGDYDPTLELGRFQLPNLDKLENHGDGKNRVTGDELHQNKENILRTLANFKIEVEKITAEVGPTVTLYEIVPAPGIRISKIKNLEDDIALSLAALGIRIIAPIPGKGTIGIEVPNSSPDVVSMRTLIASEKFQNSTAELPIALGKTISNETYVFDMAKMPHLLMAGATGQGKSVGLNAMLVSMLYRRHPSQLKFVLVDPKKVELTLYNKIIRHYLAQLPDSEDAIITDTSKVVATLNSLCVEMDQRYELLKHAQCRNIKEYNAKFTKRKIMPGQAEHPENGKDLHRLGHHYMPYIVLVVDEFADLIMTAGKEVETPIARLAQLARAIGIHLIIATQRPSVNIITGTIKANFPARVAFRVTSKIDSRTILDAGGADQLIGRGDLLMSTGNDLIRLQCGFVDTPEVEEICEYIGSQQGYPTPYELPPPPAEASENKGSIDEDDRDPMFEEAARVLVMHQQGSTSLLQRKLKLGYNRAGRLIDQLETAGIIGPFEGSKARKVLVPDEASLEQLLQSSSAATE